MSSANGAPGFPYKISIVPSIPPQLRHGQQVPYGWAVKIHRWLSDWSDTAPYEKVPPAPISEAQVSRGQLLVNLSEFEGKSTSAEKVRDIIAGRTVRFRCGIGNTAWRSRWYEAALVEVMAPFQDRLVSGLDRSYLLSVEVFLADGDRIGQSELVFANVPTWCFWDVQLDRPGGIDKIVDGRRILAGVRAQTSPADFNGEGRAGFVHAVGSQHLAAYDASGKKLWSMSDPAGVPIYNSVAARPYDINADGKDEVIAMWGTPPEARILIIEGATGKVLREASWPRNNEDIRRWRHGGNRGHVAYAYDAKIYIANSRGLDRTSDLVLQTGDDNQAVYSVLPAELEVLWEFDLRAERSRDGGAGGHSPVVYAIDGDGCDEMIAGNGDGCDEMIAGTYMLDQNGSVLWQIPFEPTFYDDHGDDHIDIADVGPVGPGGRIVVVFANNCVAADALSGEVLWKGESEHGQWAYIRNVRDDLDGNQIIFADKYGPSRLYDENGNELEWPGTGLSILADWTGDGRASENISALVTDEHGRVIGIGAAGSEMTTDASNPTEVCPLVKPGVSGSFTWWQGLNGTRALALSGIPIPPPGKGKINFPARIYNHID